MRVPQTQPGVGGPCAWGGDPQGAQRAFTVSTTSVLSGELAGSCSSFSCDEGRCDGIYARSWAQRNVASGVLEPETGFPLLRIWRHVSYMFSVLTWTYVAGQSPVTLKPP